MLSREPERKGLHLPALGAALVSRKFCTMCASKTRGEKMSLLRSLTGLVTVVFVSGMAMPWCYRIEATFKSRCGFHSSVCGSSTEWEETCEMNLPFHLQII